MPVKPATTPLLPGVCLSLFLGTGSVCAQELEPDDEQLIQPTVERPEITVPEINVDDFEVGVFLGLLNVEQFDSNAIAGIRFGYHVTSDAFQNWCSIPPSLQPKDNC